MNEPWSSKVEHRFAQYVRILGKGKSGTRSLSQSEARDAFAMIMRGEVEPVQIGAFLMLLRVKEETAQELVGFVQACRDNMQRPPPALGADLDWSSYAGKKHQHPWFVLSILLLSQAGYRIFIHGSQGHTAGRLYTESAFHALALPVAKDWQDVDVQLDKQGMCYFPLKRFCRPLDELIHMRHLLGLRSPVNTLARLLNPLAAPCALQSIFHPAYGELHQEADAILEQPRALVFKGDSGEIEIKPQADTRLLFLDNGKKRNLSLPRSIAQRVSAVDCPDVSQLRKLWRGESENHYGLQATLATTAVTLSLLTPGASLESSADRAQQLWRQRDKMRLEPCP
ncbi:MAG: glycosyl transferase family protein [Proteobacteria bacterium]|nr:glycosyl transferase family protein [Pseudomonadota bacterium]